MSLEGATLPAAMMHMAFVLSVRGIPQLYAGEEIAMEGKEDPDNRRDFPSEAFKVEGRNASQRQMFNWTREWIRVRREHPALRSGKLLDLFSDDETYVFARQLGDETVVVAFNRANKTKEISVPLGSIDVKDGATFKTLISEKMISRVVNGEAKLILSPQSARAFLFSR
jgi:glycosidase